MSTNINFTIMNESYNRISNLLEQISQESQKINNNLDAINRNISITGQYTLSSNYQTLKNNLTNGFNHAYTNLTNLNNYLLQQKNEYASNVSNTIDKLKKYLNEVTSFLNGGNIEKSGVVNNDSLSEGSTLNLTYYYMGDNYGTRGLTGSGLEIKDFKVNENGWYTYSLTNSDGTISDYVVLAGPTPYLKKDFGAIDGKTYFTYGDIVNFTSNGVTYQGVIADSCGNAMSGNAALFDIFAQNSNAVNPTSLNGVESYQLVGHAPWGGYENIGFGTIQPK